MPTINKDFLRDIRVDIDTALTAVAKKHEISLTAGHCTFDPSSGNFTFKLEGVTKGGLDKSGALYQDLRRLRPTLPELRSTFVYNGKQHEVVGANTTGTKVIAKCGDKRYQFPVDAVERLCAQPSK